MAIAGNLRTEFGDHSVKEAVISFSVSPKITDISPIERLLESGMAFHEQYHKFEPVNIREVKVNTQTDQTDIDKVIERGFKIISFEDGKTSNIIQGIPQPTHTILSFNTLKYKGWTDYMTRSLKGAEAIAEAVKATLMLSNIGVMFVDELYFEDKDAYRPEEIFNLKSRNLPSTIIESDMADLTLSTHKSSGDIDYMENISIQVFNDRESGRKVIRITGNIMSALAPAPFGEALQSDSLKRYLGFGHNKNKEMLRDILSENALKMIGLW